MSDVYHFEAGTAPLLISIPHLGSQIPHAMRALMTEAGLRSGDTDWHLDRLYAFGRRLGASFLWSRYSRYVIDLNRPVNDEHLYPGQAKTGLCPTHTFAGEPLYRDQRDSVSEADRSERLRRYWQPYHDQLRREIDRLLALHGKVLLWEAHSIASVIPRLFDGKLPELNIGTVNGTRCAASMVAAMRSQLAAQEQSDNCYTWVIDGRFKGGNITRQYGAPEQGVHAIQLEMCQSTYMDEQPPYTWRDELANRVGRTVENLLTAALQQL